MVDVAIWPPRLLADHGLCFTAVNIHPERPESFDVLLLPVLLLIVAFLGFSLGILVSALTTKYRDLQQLLGVGLQLVMYASPIIYPLSTVPENLRWIILLNPLTPVLEVFRLGFLGVSSVNPIYLVYSIGFTLITLFLSIIIFNHAEKNFLDTI